MKIILVHDSLTQLGGAERVVLAMAEMFPDAPLYVLAVDRSVLEKIPENIRTRIKTSPLQYLYNIAPKFQYLLPFIPLALWLTKLPKCDILLSSSSAFAKGFYKPGGARHINYCHTPTRFLWTDFEYVRQEVPWFLRWPAKIFLWWMRGWDLRATKRVDKFLANSKEVQKRIKKYYNRDSEVVYPFVDVSVWRNPSSVIPEATSEALPSRTVRDLLLENKSVDSGLLSSRLRVGMETGMTDEKEPYFLIAGRLHAHKHNDLVIEACNDLKINLHVVGSGRDEEYLKNIAGPTIKFFGRVSDEELKIQYAEAEGYIYPQLEDFGLMPLEASACGTPTIGADAGGSRETILPGVTGQWFALGDGEALKQILRGWDKSRYSMKAMREHAENFSKEKFMEKLRQAIFSDT